MKIELHTRGPVQPGDPIRGTVVVDVEEAFEHVDLQLESVGESSTTLLSQRLGEGLGPGRHDIPFHLEVPAGGYINQTEHLLVSAYSVGGQPEIAEKPLEFRFERTVHFGGGDTFEPSAKGEVAYEYFTLPIATGICAWALLALIQGQALGFVFAMLGVAALIIAVQVWLMRRSDNLLRLIESLEVQVEPTIDQKGARAELTIRTLGTGVLESVRFTWIGAAGEQQSDPVSPSSGAGPGLGWADSPFFEHVDHQALDAELADMETYQFESSFVPPDDAPVSVHEIDRRVTWSVEVDCKYKGFPAKSVTGGFMVGAAMADDTESENVVAMEQTEQRIALDLSDIGPEETSGFEEAPDPEEESASAQPATAVISSQDPNR